MKTYMVRGVCGVAAAMMVAGGMLMAAKSAEASEEVCHLITHYSKHASQDIIVGESSVAAHVARHGDLDLGVVECPIEEVEPIL